MKGHSGPKITSCDQSFLIEAESLIRIFSGNGELWSSSRKLYLDETRMWKDMRRNLRHRVHPWKNSLQGKQQLTSLFDLDPTTENSTDSNESLLAMGGRCFRSRENQTTFIHTFQRWAAPTPERPLLGASSAPGAERSGVGHRNVWSGSGVGAVNLFPLRK